MTKINEPKALKEVHEIRELLYEETKNLSPEERANRRENIVREVSEKYSLKVKKRV